jgi:hypothetical protein
MKVPYIPKELLNIILEYDGGINYKNGKYVNIIHKNDERYNIITPIISKKMEIMQNIELSGKGFYFEFRFDICNNVGLVYDCNFSYSIRYNKSANPKFICVINFLEDSKNITFYG